MNSLLCYVYHSKERLAKAHGSQCGFCSPGMVMSMYTLLRNNPKPTSEEVLRTMEGNWCRCTGYRPILDAFSTFTEVQLKIGVDFHWEMENEFLKKNHASRLLRIQNWFSLRVYCTPKQFCDPLYIFLKNYNTLVTRKVVIDFVTASHMLNTGFPALGPMYFPPLWGFYINMATRQLKGINTTITLSIGFL